MTDLNFYSQSGEVSLGVPPPAGLLRGAVSGEGPLADRAGHPQPPAILAESAFPEGGHVSERARRDPRRDRAGRVPEGDGAPLQPAR